MSAAANASAWRPSPRVHKLYTDHSRCKAAIGAERALHYTEYYKKLASPDATALRRSAESLAYHLDQRSIRIHDDELIVGTHTEHRIGAICHIEKAGAAMLEDVLSFETRDVNPLAIAPGVKWTLLRKVVPFWLSRNLAMRAFSLREKVRYAGDQLNAVHFVINEAAGIAHFLPDYEELIRLGTRGLRAKIEARQARETLPPEGRDYLDASLLVLDAIERFADRHRVEAERLGRDDIAGVLERVPRDPPRDLREALQLIWLFQLVIQIESVDQGISLGRMDQYLFPLYCELKSRGAVGDDEVRELFAAFCIKLSEVVPLFSRRATEYYAGLPSGQALTIGGVDAQGRDAANELSFLLLDVMEGFKTRQPNWHARISQASSPAFVRRVVEVVAGGGGSPALYNDDVIMPAMVLRDNAAEKVWNYATVGCVEPALSCESFTSSDAAIFNLALAMEWLLAGRRRLEKGDSRGRPWLREIRDLDDLLVALEEQTAERIEQLKHSLDAIERASAEYYPTPFSSLLIGGLHRERHRLDARWRLVQRIRDPGGRRRGSRELPRSDRRVGVPEGPVRARRHRQRLRNELRGPGADALPYAQDRGLRQRRSARRRPRGTRSAALRSLHLAPHQYSWRALDAGLLLHDLPPGLWPADGRHALGPTRGPAPRRRPGTNRRLRPARPDGLPQLVGSTRPQPLWQRRQSQHQVRCGDRRG